AAAVVVVLVTLGLIYSRADTAVAKLTAQGEQAAKKEKDIKLISDNEKKEGTGVPEKEMQLKRLARVGHDRGKIAHIYDRIVGLKQNDGKFVFGTDNKIFLTNLYISRIPYSGTRGSGGLDSENMNGVDKSSSLVGPQNFYLT